ncbi:glycosyltransferase family 9 protein [Microbispora cellulosiformans]|uniref:Glycosyltransferase family 9 protein n=1 Tax=Microbispora cellulosiformans TaxID=2614688 RepID=A0A5J5JZI7_9ACTN|nr:glycosyltransferase family 9 protein [Microbispora cellulosiformans]KAA9377039.1 glycosyltransferase family 9 protein [Microbispora cellulosiformans]
MTSTALVLRSDGIEGLLSVVPALRALRRHGLRVVLACPPELSELAALTGAVDRILPARGLAPLTWPGPGEEDSGHPPLLPDLAVNLHGRGPRSHRVLLNLRHEGRGVDRLWAYANRDVPWVRGPWWQPGEHEVLRWCRLLRWYGVPADPEDTTLPTPLTASPAPGAVVIHPVAGGTSLRWPAERFATVARRLSEDGLPVVITGSLRERPMALLVATRAVLPPQIVLAGRTSLRQLCALVAGARLVVSGDVALTRLAAAYRTPSVLVSPPDGPRHPVLHESGDAGAISATQVIDAAVRALGAGVR